MVLLGISGSFGGIVIVISLTCKLHGLKYLNGALLLMIHVSLR